MNTKLLLTVASLCALAISGCVSSETIIQEGSSTVEPLAKVWANEVAAQGLDVIVDGGGSGHGGKGICTGELTIGDMSRAMKTSEKELCAQNGITPLVWKVALDALSVVTSKGSFVDDLTVDQLADIFGNPEVTHWDQVDAGFPSTAISLCFPDAGSGTYDYFLEEVLEDHEFNYKTEQQVASGATHLQSANDEQIVNCVKDNDNAIAFFGFSYYDSNRATLDAVNIGGVSPSIANVVSGAYSPLGRYLYMVTSSELSAPVVEYFAYALNEGQAESLMVGAGFIPLDGPTLTEMREQLERYA
ncbi:MAG: PstS family phosphate ABC transporter substrate-binding protein [Thermoplasmatota archaeon]